MGRLFAIVRRLLWILVFLLVVVIALSGSALTILTIRGFPTTKGSLAISNLEKAVMVTRDANGIAWIEAENPHDLFLAQGYVHAQDRMWQMEVWRHISSGRLSELFGPSTLSEDRFIRTLGWHESAERDYEALPDDTRAAVTAYAAGVNAWIDDHQGALSLPFVVTGLKSGAGGIGGYRLERWTPVDTLAWQKVQAWQLGGNFDTEIFRMLADAKLGDPARTDQLFPAYDPQMPVITPSGLKGSGGAGATAAAPVAPTTAAGGSGVAGSRVAGSGVATTAIGDPAAWRSLAATGGRILQIAGLDGGEGIAGDHQVGSNNWVVGPEKTTTKTALLANDPHLGIGMPSVWYMNGLRCRTVSKTCPYDVAGVSFPGVPGVVLGHNEKIAWGATNVDPDVQDLFAIEPDPANPANYLAGGESIPYDVRHERIKVAGAADVELDVRSTRDGPIVNDVDSRLKDASQTLALRWTATDAVDGTLTAILRINAASSFDEFHTAFETYGAPSQNFVYADVDGHIGYVLPGRIPIRADPSDHGARIRPGDGAHDWTGTIPFKDLPFQLDPAGGMIVTANNAAVDASYPYFIAQEWDPGSRAKRITTLLSDAAASGGISRALMEQVQLDTHLLRAEVVGSLAAGTATTTPDGAAVAAAIGKWSSFNCPIDSAASAGCGAYLAFEYRLVRDLFDDELGPLAREYVGGSASLTAMTSLMATPDSPWWDDVSTTGVVETRNDIVGRALDEAGKELRAAYGDPQNWTWGRMHTARFEEATLGTSGIAPLEWYFDKGPFPAPGAAGAIDNTYYRPSRAYPDPDDPTYQPVGIDGVFSVTNLPSYRLTIDMGDLDGARIVQTTGQSGNPFDRHYGDLIDDWLGGTNVPLPFSRVAVSGATVETLQLVPRAGG